MLHRAIDVNATVIRGVSNSEGSQRDHPLKKDIANGEWGQSLKKDKFNIWPNQLIQWTR